MDEDALKDLKDKMRRTWMAGDFGRIAQHSEHIAEEFVARLSLQPGLRVLDLACGTGNIAIPAARSGAIVTGVDIAPNLLKTARSRAEAGSLAISFDEADAEALPYADASFDLVVSMFGAMFAPRPERVAAEMARVCKPGGKMAMANWTPQSFSGRMAALTSRYLPPPPNVPPPVLWGDPIVAKERLIAYSSDIETIQRPIDMAYPFPPRAVVQLFREFYGPTKTAFARLDSGNQASYASDLEALWAEHNQDTAGATRIRNKYLQITALKT